MQKSRYLLLDKIKKYNKRSKIKIIDSLISTMSENTGRGDGCY